MKIEIEVSEDVLREELQRQAAKGCLINCAVGN
jgi:hypothetical protein